jgi:hypothetical protein
LFLSIIVSAATAAATACTKVIASTLHRRNLDLRQPEQRIAIFERKTVPELRDG